MSVNDPVGYVNFEEVYSTLFARVAAATGLKGSTRRVTPLELVQPSDCPYLILVQGQITQETQRTPKLPNKWVLHCDLVLINKAGADPNAIPLQPLNPIASFIVMAMRPPDGLEKQTLGLSYVYDARIEGEILPMDAGDGDAIVVIPIRIVSA